MSDMRGVQKIVGMNDDHGPVLDSDDQVGGERRLTAAVDAVDRHEAAPGSDGVENVAGQ